MSIPKQIQNPDWITKNNGDEQNASEFNAVVEAIKNNAEIQKKQLRFDVKQGFTEGEKQIGRENLGIDLSKVIEKLEGDPEGQYVLLADGTRIDPQTLVTEKEVVTYDASNPRPAVGEEGKLYIDTDTDKGYLWDEATQDYIGIGVIDLSNYYNKQEIDGLLEQSIITISSDTTLTNAHHNVIIVITGNCEITVPSGLKVGFNCSFDIIGSNIAEFIEGVDATFSAPYGKFLRNNTTCVLYKMPSGIYRLTGALAPV